jgi:hypothetical protein
MGLSGMIRTSSLRSARQLAGLHLKLIEIEPRRTLGKPQNFDPDHFPPIVKIQDDSRRNLFRFHDRFMKRLSRKGSPMLDSILAGSANARSIQPMGIRLSARTSRAC